MEKLKAPTWFMVVAIILLLWDLMGVFAFATDQMMTEEMLSALPEGQQTMYRNTPAWMSIVYGIATIGAAIGSIGLIVKKSWAKWLFLASLSAVVIQFGYSFLVLNAFAILGPSALILPLLIILIGIYQVWLSNKAIKAGWLH